MPAFDYNAAYLGALIGAIVGWIVRDWIARTRERKIKDQASSVLVRKAREES